MPALQRIYYVNGESLVTVKFGDHVLAPFVGSVIPPTATVMALNLAPGNVVVDTHGVVIGTVATAAVNEGTGQVTVTFSNGTTQTYTSGQDVLIQAPSSLPNTGGTKFQLGLSVDPIKVMPQFSHKDYRADDFGQESPPDVMWCMGTAMVTMNLIHFDMAVLDYCTAEAMGGFKQINPSTWAGSRFGKANMGTPIGGGGALYSSGNHFIGVSVYSERAAFPWRFPASYLLDRVEIPLGTERTEAKLTWRAIPYPARFSDPRQEYVKSDNTNIWEHTLDA